MNAYERAKGTARVLLERLGERAFDVGVVLGSGWVGTARALGEVQASCSFGDLPGFPAPTAPGHAGSFQAMRLGSSRVAVMLGRVHLYEGHEPSDVVHGVRSLVMAGASTLVLTNAAGGIRAGLEVGQTVLLRDQINFTGASPLAGANPDALGPRFPDLSDLYAAELRAQARTLEPTLTEGVYVGFRGPMFETPAEIAMARGWGADLVGMSTVLEAIAARHLGARVLGVSLVTNLAAGLPGAKLDAHDILGVAEAAADRTGRWLRALLYRSA